MKQLVLILIAAFMLTQSFCYLATTDKSRVVLKSMPPADVTALHIAVYDTTPDNLLLYQVFAPGDTVELEVPSGENRIFVIWGETTQGIAKYYGVSSPTNIGGDNTEEVTLSMKQFSATVAPTVFQLVYYSNSGVAQWNAIYGTENYQLQCNKGSGAPSYQTIYFGPDTSSSNTAGCNNGFSVKANSSLFNLQSESGTP